jgi:glycosyltransferase involved in cell wall biosynthesis
MRIIQVVPSIANQSSGPSYSVTRMCEELVRRGVDLSLLCLGDSIARHPAEWIRCFPHIPQLSRLGVCPAMHRWLVDAARALPRPILHNHSLWMMPNVYPGRVARSLGVPYVVSPRGTFGPAAFEGGSLVKKLFWPLVQRPSLDAVSCFHATAHSEAAEIRAFGFRQPIAVIPNGVDIPVRCSELQSRRREVLFLGRVHPQKGIDTLFHAWRSVQDRFPDWSLRIVGPDNRGHLPKMHALANELAVRRVTFEGELSGESRTRAYQSASLFVLPTRGENFGMAVAEALACGTPCIVTRGAPWSGLRTQDCGWWVDANDEAFASAMNQAMRCSPDRLHMMGENGRRWMQRDFSWDSVGCRMSELYQWLLNGMPGSDRLEDVVDL